MRSRSVAAGLLALLIGLTACGRYGPPVRRAPEDRPRPPASEPQPAPEHPEEPPP